MTLSHRVNCKKILRGVKIKNILTFTMHCGQIKFDNFKYFTDV